MYESKLMRKLYGTGAALRGCYLPQTEKRLAIDTAAIKICFDDRGLRFHE